MAIMTHTKFHSNRLMLTLVFGIWASEPPPPPPPRAWRSTDKTGPDRVKQRQAVSKLRISGHKLQIELGGYHKASLELRERKCPFCPNEVEDEYHFIAECQCTVTKVWHKHLIINSLQTYSIAAKHL